jgi:hypothetical protein
MKKTILSLALVCALGLVSGLASFQGAPRGCHDSIAATDDPPPNPADCPLCAGDASLHMKRLGQLSELGVELAFNQLMRVR